MERERFVAIIVALPFVIALASRVASLIGVVVVAVVATNGFYYRQSYARRFSNNITSFYSQHPRSRRCQTP